MTDQKKPRKLRVAPESPAEARRGPEAVGMPRLRLVGPGVLKVAVGAGLVVYLGPEEDSPLGEFVDRDGVRHDHRFPGALEWLLCPNCGLGAGDADAPGYIGFQGVEDDPCPRCGKRGTIGCGWVCCLGPVVEEED